MKSVEKTSSGNLKVINFEGFGFGGVPIPYGYLPDKKNLEKMTLVGVCREWSDRLQSLGKPVQDDDFFAELFNAMLIVKQWAEVHKNEDIQYSEE